MSYIGNTNTTQGFTPAVDYFSGNGSTVAFTLSRPVASVAQVQATISNVPQNPSSAFSVSGNTITFTSAPLSGTNNIYVYYTSPITQVIAPGQGTVTSESFGTIVNFTTTGNTVLGDASTDTLNVGNGGLVKDASGNVGIGTSSPTAQLQLNKSGTGDYTTFRLSNSGASGRVYEIGVGGNTAAAGYANNLYFYDSTASTLRMVLDSSGNVGIGTSSPTQKLSVQGAGRFNRNAVSTVGAVASSGLMIDGAGYNGNISQIGFGYDATALTYMPAAIYGITTTQSGYTAMDIAFATRSVTTDTAPTERMRIDSSGNLLVGTTGNNVSDKAISVSADTQLSWYWAAGNSYANVFNQPSSASLCMANGYQRGTNGADFKSSVNAAWAKSAVEVAYGAIKFYADPVSTVALGTVITPTLRATIDSSGNLLVGTTNTVPGYANTTTGATLNPNGSSCFSRSGADFTMVVNNNTGSTYNLITFRASGSYVGQITSNGTTTSYTSGSDYRLKNTIEPMTGALEKVSLLKPCTYKWNADNSDGEGFIAHELAEVCPHAVVGEKDAVETYTDDEGNEQTRPKYQGIDTSFLVATLTAAIQEQQAIIQTLTDRITALENK